METLTYLRLERQRSLKAKQAKAKHDKCDERGCTRRSRPKAKQDMYDETGYVRGNMMFKARSSKVEVGRGAVV